MIGPERNISESAVYGFHIVVDGCGHIYASRDITVALAEIDYFLQFRHRFDIQIHLSAVYLDESHFVNVEFRRGGRRVSFCDMRVFDILVGLEEIGIIQILEHAFRAFLLDGKISPRRIHDVPFSFTVAVGVYEDFVPSVATRRLLLGRKVFQIFVCHADDSHRFDSFHSAKESKRF